MGGCASASCQRGSGHKFGRYGKGPAALMKPTGKHLRKATVSGTGNYTYSRQLRATDKPYENREKAVVVNGEVTLLLHMAAKSGKNQLLTHSVAMPGVKLEDTDCLGSTPLHYAARFGQKEAVAILIQAGASIEARDAEGSMPLHAAASAGHLETLSLLLDARSDISAVDDKGNSALHLAAARSWSSDQIGQLLLDEGAEVNLTNFYGYTPLACADDWGSRSFTDLIRKCGGTR
mmetsp:Transcript_26869/g.52616  ORF Transcript_26869/g.52616 Transcript_26869/m.52616 type:complete len:234 (-) Transcript_26869:131-832(-)